MTDLVAAHQRLTWRVAFVGFAPGFGYLVPDGDWPEVPRRADPRTRVPAGSVARGGALLGCLPRRQPRRLAADRPHRRCAVWDAEREPPALLVPGTTVRFEAVRSSTVTAELEVVEPGPLTTVQDLGRPGLGSLGVSPSGAADRASARRANALVANPAGAAVLEVTLGGLVLRARGDCEVALAGASVAPTVDGARVEGDVLSLADGATLRLGRPSVGVRTYLAVRGGVDVRPVLGSRSTDLLSGLGPAPLARGDVLPVGDACAVRGARRSRDRGRPATSSCRCCRGRGSTGSTTGRSTGWSDRRTP